LYITSCVRLLTPTVEAHWRASVIFIVITIARARDAT